MEHFSGKSGCGMTCIEALKGRGLGHRQLALSYTYDIITKKQKNKVVLDL